MGSRYGFHGGACSLSVVQGFTSLVDIHIVFRLSLLYYSAHSLSVVRRFADLVAIHVVLRLSHFGCPSVATCATSHGMSVLDARSRAIAKHYV